MKIILGLVAFSAVTAVAYPIQKAKSKPKLRFHGINESGAEFGAQNLPGTLGTDYTWPSESSIDTLVGEGFNIFRIPFLMERLIPNQMTGSPDPAYLSGLTNIVNHITSKGAHAIVDPHNFGRYYGNVITDVSAFKAFWSTVATQFAKNSKVVFDTNNEYHDMDQTLVLNLNQAAIDGIRAAGATQQLIFVEGNSYSGAWTWTQVNDNLKSLTDPSNKLVYEMHQYLDSDGSGTSDQCVSSTIGQERVQAATAWLRTHQKRGFLGEFAGGANPTCKQAVQGMLNVLTQHARQWLGACWWAGGPWWGNYMFAFEPPSSTAYDYYLSTLEALG